MSLPARHWDFVLTCFEPIARVTGGIGTYSRLLLEQLVQPDSRGASINVLFLTSATHGDELPEWAHRENFHIEKIGGEVSIDGLPVRGLPGGYRHFGLGALHRLQALADEGHTFGLLEVPDYNAEGYFLIKAQRLGLLQFSATSVRLHSPMLMLHVDNDSRAAAAIDNLRTYEEERYMYAHADAVLYGGDAMLERVLHELPDAQRESVRSRAVKIQHPWPAPSPHSGSSNPGQAYRFGYVGRLEYRKGVDLLVDAAVEALQILNVQAEFHFYGRDTDSFRGRSVRSYLDSKIPEALRNHFVFHDYVPQQVLWSEHLPKLDAFVFPSRFENYPNVLLEVLEFGKPVLVSKHGCMPEMAHGFSQAEAFEPFDRAGFAQLLGRTTSQGPRSMEARATYAFRRDEVRGKIESGYGELRKRRPARRAPVVEGRVAVVVTHYNKPELLTPLLESLKPQMRAGDELVVVDDCSSPVHARRARELTEFSGATFIQTRENAGPSFARNLGAANTSAEWLHFVDGDDELEAGGLDALRRILGSRPEVDVACGYLRSFQDAQEIWAGSDPTAESILVANATHCGILVRRSMFERVGGYQSKQRLHFEDWELNMRLALHGARFEITPEVTYRYRVDHNTGRHASFPELEQRSREECLRHALASVPTERLPDLRNLLVSLLMRQPQVVIQHQAADALRYRIADKVNEALKRSPVHSLIKRGLALRRS